MRRGLKIEIARVRAEKSRKEIAAALNVTSQTIINWENSRTEMPIDKAIAFCNYLNIDIKELTEN